MIPQLKKVNTKLQLILPLSVWIAMVAFAPLASDAQETFRLVPVTVYEKKPVTITRWVDETLSQKQQVTSYKPIWETETRERTRTTYKPVEETAVRLEKVVVRKPIVETMMRTVKREETTHETVTKYRDEEYTVREPVMETQMRTEEYTVSKPVTKRMIEVKKTTTYKPVVKPETLLVPTELPVLATGARPDPNARPRIQMLQSGYYTDPVSGATVYRRRGLHWVQPTLSEPRAATVPALVPQQYSKLAFVPETKEERSPIEITRYVDEVKTRRVPVEVKKMVERTMTRTVPYEVKIPKVTVTTEEIPYTRTTYKDETITKRVPYTRTRLQEVVTTEPYEVKVPKWITETKEIEVPKTVTRKVQQTYMQDVPQTVMMKVPVDICGNPIGSPMPLNQMPLNSIGTSNSSLRPVVEPSTQPELSIGTGTTLNAPRTNANKPMVTPTEARGYRGVLTEEPVKTLDETGKSVLKTEASSESFKEISSEPTGESKFKEITNTFIDNGDGRPRASEWRTDDPFSEYEIESSDNYSPFASRATSSSQSKTLVETSGLGPIEEPTQATTTETEPDVSDLLESPSKPTDIQSTETGDENAADPGAKANGEQ